MNFFTRFLLILSFFTLIKINNVYGGVWNWTSDNMDCIKGKFNGYVDSMEKIFAPNNSLGRKSIHNKIINIKRKAIMEYGNFVRVIGPIIEQCKNHLNHEIITADPQLSEQARGVVLYLCEMARRDCPQVANPIPISDQLHDTYVKVLRGQEHDFLEYCGEYITNTEPSESAVYFKTEKKPTRKSRFSGRLFGNL